MRWATSGRNWEGREWWLADGLVTFATQVDTVWPTPRPADGTVASRGHDAQNASSDHRPRPTTGRGVVRAIDVGVVPGQGPLLTEALRMGRDPRVRYVIHDKRIFSSYGNASRDPWEWGPYTGLNGHITHVHLSTLASGDGQGQPWLLPGVVPDTMTDSMLPLTYGDGMPGPREYRRSDVAWLQNLLNDSGRMESRLVTDGRYGDLTAAAVLRIIPDPSVDSTGRTVTGNMWARLERIVQDRRIGLALEGLPPAHGGVTEAEVRDMIAGTRLAPG